eukprot:357423-Chlamydomonas_euryale.AAC.2
MSIASSILTRLSHRQSSHVYRIVNTCDRFTPLPQSRSAGYSACYIAGGCGAGGCGAAGCGAAGCGAGGCGVAGCGAGGCGVAGCGAAGCGTSGCVAAVARARVEDLTWPIVACAGDVAWPFKA